MKPSWTACFYSALLVGAALLPSPAFSGPPGNRTDQPDFMAVLHAQPPSLSSLASDADALTLFSSTLGPAMGLKDSAAVLMSKQSSSQKLSGGKASSSSSLDQASTADLTEQAVRLTAELAAWHLAISLQEAVESEEAPAVQRVLGQAATQRSWLLDTEGRRALRRAVDLMALDLTLTSAQPVQTGVLSGYAEYEAYLDQTYPRLTGGAESWLAVAEREGAEGIRRRLMEFGKSGAGHEADREALMRRYVALRLHPMLTSQAIASAARAEAEAERQARDAWRLVQTWRDRVQELKGLARLCGTWHWTIHNHQNHQDHRTVMSFPPANAPAPPASLGQPGPHPAKIVAWGDLVYLRWEFQGGYQEDSLLFAGEGQRLEGTFVNSAGAWGSITGKRAASCPREKESPH